MERGIPELSAANGGAAGPPVPELPDLELIRRIGVGAYREFWLARTVLGVLRAVKVTHQSRFPEARPFEREFEEIRRFEPISRSHPRQLAILDVGKGVCERNRPPSPNCRRYPSGVEAAQVAAGGKLGRRCRSSERLAGVNREHRDNQEDP